VCVCECECGEDTVISLYAGLVRSNVASFLCLVSCGWRLVGTWIHSFNALTLTSSLFLPLSPSFSLSSLSSLWLPLLSPLSVHLSFYRFHALGHPISMSLTLTLHVRYCCVGCDNVSCPVCIHSCTRALRLLFWGSRAAWVFL
jgi:hypothetical protein